MSERSVVPVSDYSVVKMDPTVLREIIQENIGADALSEFDLDRVKVPAGGGVTWEVPSLEGTENVKELTGVVVHWKQPRAYWSVGFDESGGGTPPDCASDDGFWGIGDPGGECDKCPLAQFGSDSKGRGQACKQMRLLFMVRPTDLLPLVVACPPTSIRPVKRYFLRLASQAIPFYGVVTKVTLERTKNQDGIQYAQVVPQMVQRLDDGDMAKMKAYAESLRPAMERVTITHDDFAVGDADTGA